MSHSTLLPPAYAAECDALGAVAASARAQLDALRTGHITAFETASASTLDAVGVLDRCQSARRRMLAQGTPAGMPEAREALVAAADDAQRACDDLAFALAHAVALGREMLGAWQKLTAPPTANVYTARGHVGPPDGGSHLVQTG